MDQETTCKGDTLRFPLKRQETALYALFIYPQWLRKLILQLRSSGDMELGEENERTMHLVKIRGGMISWIGIVDGYVKDIGRKTAEVITALK